MPLGSSWAVLETSWANLEVSWALLGRLGGHVGTSWANLRTILAVLGTILSHLEAVWSRKNLGDHFWAILGGLSGWPAGRAEAPGGVLLEKEPKPKPKGFSTPGTPVMNQQGAADRRRLRRITAAPCPFGSAYVAERCGQSSPKRSKRQLRSKTMGTKHLSLASSGPPGGPLWPS